MIQRVNKTKRGIPLSPYIVLYTEIKDNKKLTLLVTGYYLIYIGISRLVNISSNYSAIVKYSF